MSRGPDGELQNPNFIGAAGRAWELTATSSNLRVEHTASLGGWLIEAPFAHPAWNYHVASLVHLREIPGAAPAVIKFNGASHEFMMYALDPRFEEELDPDNTDTLKRILEPFDMVEQLKVDSDDRALEVVRFAVQKCVEGELLPDADGRNEWRNFFRSQE